MQPGDRLICAFTKSHAVSERFSRWYLHVTIVPWFRLADASEQIAQSLTEALSQLKPFEAAGEEIAPFRSRRNKPVRLLRQPSPFMEIEQKVRSYLHKKRAWLVDETTKKRQEFRPHVTAQDDAAFEEREKFSVDRIYIVEQKGEYKEIVAEVPLHG